MIKIAPSNSKLHELAKLFDVSLNEVAQVISLTFEFSCRYDPDILRDLNPSLLRFVIPKGQIDNWMVCVASATLQRWVELGVRFSNSETKSTAAFGNAIITQLNHLGYSQIVPTSTSKGDIFVFPRSLT